MYTHAAGTSLIPLAFFNPKKSLVQWEATFSLLTNPDIHLPREELCPTESAGEAQGDHLGTSPAALPAQGSGTRRAVESREHPCTFCSVDTA